MTTAADSLAADLARQAGRLRWYAIRPPGSSGYRFAASPSPQAGEQAGLRGVWHPDFATSIWDKLFFGMTVGTAGYLTAGRSLSALPSLYWPTPAAMAEAVRRFDPTLIGYGPDAWLAHFGGSADPGAECKFAHIFWWHASRGMGDWAVGAFRTWRAARQAVMGGIAEPEIGPSSTMAIMGQPLRSYERGDAANNPAPIKVDDLDWYLAGMKPLLDKMRAAQPMPGGALTPDLCLRAYGDCMRSGGDLFCSEPQGPYLMSWVMAAKYFAKVTIPGNLAEQWAWAAWEVFYKSNEAGFTSTSIDAAIVNSILTAVVVTAQNMMDRINAESADLANLKAAALYADAQHSIFIEAQKQARQTAAAVRAVTEFMAGALPAVQASGNQTALHQLTVAQQNAQQAEAAVARFDTKAAVTYSATALSYAKAAAESAGDAIDADTKRKLQLEKATDVLKYLLVGGLGLAAAIVLVLALKE